MALPLKSGADLYNNEALRMRLHNLGADPTEVGAGLIYFNTSSGMNTSKKARIYTGDAWKTLAFVEDLDVASNADFIALQEKVALLAGDVDTDSIISNMKEVSAFLSGFAEDASLMGLLNSKADKAQLENYLPLTGGRMSGNLIMNNGHIVTRECYASADNTYNLGHSGRRWANIHTILINGGTPIHSGNIGSQSVESAIDALRFKALASSGDLNTVLAGGGMARTYNDYLTNDFTNAPSGASYGTVLQLSAAGFFGLDALSGQLAWDVNHNNTTDATRYLWWRASDANGFTNSKWHQIAFTDSNVASATKLKTARMIWGQAFDGTGNLSGSIFLDNGSALCFKDANGTDRIVTTLNSGNLLSFGFGTAMANYDTMIYGNSIKLAYGKPTDYTTGITLNSLGNVGIGTNSPEYKLDVSGDARVVGNLLVEGNIIATGEVSAGGDGEEGTSGSGAGAFHAETIAKGATSVTIAHGLATDDIVVSIFEKDATSGLWSMILTDIEITDANNIRVTFGSLTTVEHKVVIMGAVA